MKKLFFILAVVCFAATGLCTRANAQSGDGDVTLEMTDGTTKRGWCRTKMVNDIKHIEISAEPKGERVRYDNDQIARMVFDDGSVYVKQDFISKANGDKTRNSWLRRDYEGRGITVYSRYVEKAGGNVGGVGGKSKSTVYYFQMDDDPAILVAGEFHKGGPNNNTAANRPLLVYYFSKRYPQYADLAGRIKAKEFNVKGSPMEVVRAWEEAYGGR